MYEKDYFLVVCECLVVSWGKKLDMVTKLTSCFFQPFNARGTFGYSQPMLATQLTTLIVVAAVVVVVSGETFDVDAERGRVQYEMLKADVGMPKYGPCWQSALDDLHQG